MRPGSNSPEYLLEIEQLRQLIIAELSDFGKVKGDEITILCPFHPDKNPSLNVHIGTKKMPGIFKCWSGKCGAKGGWNKLAAALRLKSYNGKYLNSDNRANTAKTVTGTNNGDVNFFEVLERSIVSQPPVQMKELRRLHGTGALPEDFQWRGVTGKLLEAIGGRYYYDRKLDTDFLYFPLTINNEYKGYTLCALDRSNPKVLKYQTFANTQETFFLYDHLPPNGPVALVEGHFDAIRLFSLGIPVLAIFGTENWSTIKKELLIAKCPSKVLVCFDGDEAGYKASIEIFNDLRAGVNVDIFYLPYFEKKEDRLDPGNMPTDMVKQLECKLLSI